MYKIINGYIVSPGKFEGEPSWILKLWDLILDGSSDVSVHDGTMVIDAFALDDEMAQLTGKEATPNTYICVWSNDAGQVSHCMMSADDLFKVEGFNVDPFDFDDYPVYESGY